MTVACVWRELRGDDELVKVAAESAGVGWSRVKIHIEKVVLVLNRRLIHFQKQFGTNLPRTLFRNLLQLLLVFEGKHD